MSSINCKNLKKQAKLIESWMNRLPGEDLLAFAESRISKRNLKNFQQVHPIFLKWLERRAFNQLLGKSLKARLLLEPDNPAWEALQKGHIRKFDYEKIMLLVDFYQAILNLLQVSWRYFKEPLKSFDSNKIIKNPTIYFMAMMMENVNREYKDYILGYQETLTQTEERAKGLRNFLWSKASKDSWINEEKLPNLPSFHRAAVHTETNATNFYLDLIISVCSKAAKSDKAVLNKLEDFKQVTIRMCDEQVKECQAERGKKPPHVAESLKWSEGIPFTGIKGGWKRMS